MSILSDFLRRLGVTSYNDLNAEEKNTYRQWELQLSGRELTEKEVRAFLEQELEASIATLIGQPLGERDDIFLKMKVDFIRRLCVFLDSPKAERSALEQAIRQNI